MKKENQLTMENYDNIYSSIASDKSLESRIYHHISAICKNTDNNIPMLRIKLINKRSSKYKYHTLSEIFNLHKYIRPFNKKSKSILEIISEDYYIDYSVINKDGSELFSSEYIKNNFIILALHIDYNSIFHLSINKEILRIYENLNQIDYTHYIFPQLFVENGHTIASIYDKHDNMRLITYCK